MFNDSLLKGAVKASGWMRAKVLDKLLKSDVECLVLSEANFENAEGFNRLSSLSRLKHLELRVSNIESHWLSALRGLELLESLDFSLSFMIDDSAIPTLASLKNLRHLDLRGCYITRKGLASDEGIALVSRLSRLGLTLDSDSLKFMLESASKLDLDELHVDAEPRIKYSELASLANKMHSCKVFRDGNPISQLSAVEIIDLLGDSNLKSLPPVSLWPEDFASIISAQTDSMAKSIAIIETFTSISQPSRGELQAMGMLALKLMSNISADDVRAKLLGNLNRCFFKNGINGLSRMILQENESVMRMLISELDAVKDAGTELMDLVYIAATDEAPEPLTDNIINLIKERYAEISKTRTICPVCKKEVLASHMSDDRCPACWQKSFDDWNDRSEASDE